MTKYIYFKSAIVFSALFAVLSTIGKAENGIRNNGNTCFFNASLQCLRNLPGFSKFLDKKAFGNTSEEFVKFTKTMNHLPLLNCTREKFGLNVDNSSSFFSYSHWFSQNGPQEEDAAEFTRLLLAAMIEDEDRSILKGISSYFLGNYKNEIHCLFNTNASSKKYLDTVVLPLNCVDTLHNGLIAYTAPDQMGKSQAFTTQPEYLVMQLKRFNYEFNSTTHNFHTYKVLASMQFPFQGLAIDEYMSFSPLKRDLYDLVGILVHDGLTINGGHYYALCKSIKDGHWYNFNDSFVSGVSEDIVKNIAAGVSMANEGYGKYATPYMLFYAKKHNKMSSKNAFFNDIKNDENKVLDLSNQIQSFNAIINDSFGFYSDYDVQCAWLNKYACEKELQKLRNKIFFEKFLHYIK